MYVIHIVITRYAVYKIEHQTLLFFSSFKLRLRFCGMDWTGINLVRLLFSYCTFDCMWMQSNAQSIWYNVDVLLNGALHFQGLFAAHICFEYSVKKNITMASHTTCCYNTPTTVYIIEFITYNNVFKTFLLLRAAVVVCIFGCIQTQQCRCFVAALFYWLRSIASIKPLNTWLLNSIRIQRCR